MSVRSGLLLLALFVSTPCFAAKPVSLPAPIAPELQVEMIESQQEMAVTVPATAAAVGMQFGLVGALIGSAVQNSQVKSAEEKMVPLRNLLVEYPFNRKMEAALRAKLTAEGISPSPVLTVMATPWEAHDAQQSAALPPQAMVLVPSYAMDSDFSQMTVGLHASVVDRTIKPNGKVKAKARFSRFYSFQFPLHGERSDNPAQDWVNFESGGMAQLLDQGIAQVTDMLVQDFSAEGRAMWETKPKKESAVVNGNVYPGMQVRAGEGWAWVRRGKGHMQSVQGFQPLTVGVLSITPAAPLAAAAVAGAVQPALPSTGPEAAAASDAADPVSPVAVPPSDALPAAPAAAPTGG